MENLKYENRIVAFIDILGFKEIINESENDLDKLELIYSVLHNLKDQEVKKYWDTTLIDIEESTQRREAKEFDILNRIEYSCFSDSIVVSVSVDNGNINALFSTLISHLADIGASLIEEGILFRGAITIGKLIHKESGVIFGKGLIEAYTLESSISEYPRIIISDKLLKELYYPISKKNDTYPYHQYLKRFKDGCVGFHQMIIYEVLQNTDAITNEQLVIHLAKTRKTILKGLDISFQNPRIFKKYNWLKDEYEALIIHEKKCKKAIYELNKSLAINDIYISQTNKIRDLYMKSRKN